MSSSWFTRIACSISAACASPVVASRSRRRRRDACSSERWFDMDRGSTTTHQAAPSWDYTDRNHNANGRPGLRGIENHRVDGHVGHACVDGDEIGSVNCDNSPIIDLDPRNKPSYWRAGAVIGRKLHD